MAKKITKQKIISETIMYVGIVAFIILFKTIFGDENTLIGVTTVTAMLMFMGSNLTISPVKNTTRLIIMNLFIGIAAYIANMNVWLAIPINFIAMFIILYTFYYNLKNSLYLPFSLQYLFILATPISAEALPLRLVSLLVGPIGIMILQLALNRNKITKVGNDYIAKICEDLLNLINEEKNENIILINKSINNSITQFKKVVYENRKDDFYITEEGRIKLDIIVSLEKLAILIKKKKKESSKEIKSELSEILTIIKTNFNKEENIQAMYEGIEDIIGRCNEENITCIIDLEFINTLGLLSNSLKELHALGKENYNKVQSYEDIPEKYKKLNSYKNEFYKKTMKFSYAVRASLGVTIAAFIADFFHLAEGRWIYFTALSLVVPIFEHSKQKTKDRVEGTIIGGIIVVILFGIFKDTTIRMIILMGAGYIKAYTEGYMYGMICTTVSAIGAAAITGGAGVLTVERILFIILGGVIAFLVNKLVMPVKITDANRELEVMYADVVNEMIHELYESLKNKSKGTHEIDNMLIATSLIEDRFASNNNTLKSNEVDKYLQAQRGLVINIHELHTLINIDSINEEDIKYVLEDLSSLIDFQKENVDEVINRVDGHINSAKNIKDKIILINIKELFVQLFEVNKLRKEIPAQI